MTNPEQNNLPQTSNDSSGSQMQNEAETFCRVMTQLNAVALEQTKGLLEIAVNAAEKINSLASAGNQPTAADHSTFVDEIKNHLANIDRRSREFSKNISESADESILAPAIAQAISLAVENSAANQQQLNVIGTAILSQAASLLLGSESAEIRE